MYWLIVVTYLAVEYVAERINQGHRQSIAQGETQNIGLGGFGGYAVGAAFTLIIALFLFLVFPESFLQPVLDHSVVALEKNYPEFLIYDGLTGAEGLRKGLVFLALASLKALIIFTRKSIGASAKLVFAAGYALLLFAVLFLFIHVTASLHQSYWAVTEKTVLYVNKVSDVRVEQPFDKIRKRRIECIFESPVGGSGTVVYLKDKRRFWINYIVVFADIPEIDIVAGDIGPAGATSYPSIELSLSNDAYLKMLVHIDAAMNAAGSAVSLKHAPGCAAAVDSGFSEPQAALLRRLLGL